MNFFNLARIYRKLSGYLLLIFFLNLFISVTFFNHTHLVDGITVVHSHPYKNHSGDHPVNHNHSDNGFLLIQYISNLITVVAIVFTGIAIPRNIIDLQLENQVKKHVLSLYLISFHRPRAPTL